jgi:hypothetical protein
MSSIDDLRAAAGCADNHDVYREMVALEAGSTFAFQGQRWLADVSPDLLSASLRRDVDRAKDAARHRQTIEAEIPPHLLFTSGWPTCRPTSDEAALLASVRARVSQMVGVDADHVTAQSVLGRYDELLRARRAARAEVIPQTLATNLPVQAELIF